jgi:chondroitin 4-sulfotransferase 11|tara:strand:+ start:1444 stop:2043 length:600 start_codon:yes stop_codon:yes gene_type:complete
MINHELKCIFIHIPRCAGTYVEKVLDGRDWWRVDKAQKHLSAEEAKARYSDVWDEYFKFGFVRNPWALEVSWYFWKNRQDIDISFEKFVNNAKLNSTAKISQNLGDKRFANLWSDHGSCYDWLSCDGRIELDFVGKVENIEEDIAHVCESLNTTFVQRHRWNQTKHAHYSRYYAEKSKQTVETRYAKDIEHFSYKYQNK